MAMKRLWSICPAAAPPKNVLNAAIVCPLVLGFTPAGGGPSVVGAGSMAQSADPSPPSSFE